MDKISAEVEACLSACQCHFNWGLEEYEDSHSDPKLQVEDYIHRYNVLEPGKVFKRFRTSMFLSYIMYRGGLDGWDKLLENGFRIMENSRDPNHPLGRNPLPSYDSPSYTGSIQEFFAEEDLTTASVSNKDDDHNSVSDESDHDEDIKEEYSFTGLYVAAEHIYYSLKATILFRIGSSFSEVRELLSHAVHMDDMTSGDRAALLYIKAITIRRCGDKGLDSAEDILKTCILTDPDNVRWPLMLIIHLAKKRHSKWGQAVDKSEIQSLVQVIDSVLQHDLKPWMRARYQFVKLQALNELGDNRKEMSFQELSRLYQTCDELSQTLARTTDKPNILAYCAQYLSKDHRKIPEAVRLIEKVLEKKPDDRYVNTRACNIYKKTGKLDKALECAEKAAKYGFGSCWQVLELKIALKHNLDYEEFFGNLITNYPQDNHIKITLRNAALFYVTQGDFRPALEHFKTLLDMCDSDDYIYGEVYGGVNPKKLHTVEAAYNVALYVLSSDYEQDDSEGSVGLCNRIRGAIEEKFDLNGFKKTGIVTPKQYVEWLRQKNVRGSRFHGGRLAGGERSSNYQDRGSTYQNHYSMNRFGDNRADDQNRFGNRSDSCRTAFRDRDHPPRQSHNRSSELGGMSASSAGNMANYFARLGSSASVDNATTRTTRPQAGMYSGDNQRNYRPSRFENWRSRSDLDGETRQNDFQSSYTKKSVDLGGNWRDRDNSDTP